MTNATNNASNNDIRPASAALVTGATSGLGFETAVHLAEAGADRVVVTGRTAEKAQAARLALMERTGRSVFEALELDLNGRDSVDRAVARLASTGTRFETVILNAGMVGGSELVRTDVDIEITYSSSLIGHHQLTMGLLAAELLASDARIVISGSEAARGDVPTFNPVDLHEHAAEHYDGDLRAAAEGLIRHDGTAKYKPGDVYATTKLFVAYWAAALSRRLPDEMTVNAVSPGSAPGTLAVRNANFFMKRVMVPVMKSMPKRMGMAASVPDAARRYVEAAGFGPEVSGEFFASAPKKMTGPLHRVELPHVLDVERQEAAWEATIEVAGAELPASV